MATTLVGLPMRWLQQPQTPAFWRPAAITGAPWPPELPPAPLVLVMPS